MPHMVVSRLARVVEPGSVQDDENSACRAIQLDAKHWRLKVKLQHATR